jgi:hypothetical protein
MKLDVQFLAQDTIMELSDAFGPAGPLTFLALMLECRARPATELRREPHTVAMRYRSLARRVAITEDEAYAIVAACVPLGLLELLEQDRTRFKAFMPKGARWEGQDVTAADRKASQRVSPA